jgi:type I restriction enzyme S subunit
MVCFLKAKFRDFGDAQTLGTTEPDMSEWKEYKLGEIAEFRNGKERPNTQGHVPIYGGNGILGYTDQYNSVGEVVVIGRVGAYCGSVFFENRPIWVSDNALFAVPKNSNDTMFLSYFLKNLDLNSFAEGSSHPLLTQTLLNSIDVVIPTDPSEQRAIASVLGSLDDQIDLLHRQNKTLEALAETLFRQWFVEEAEKGWEVGILEDEFDFTMGQSPPGSTLNEDGNGMVFYQGRTDFGFRFPEPRVFTTEPTRLAQKFDTLVSVRAPVGDVNMAIEDCCLGRGVAAFRYKRHQGFRSYTYYKMRSLMHQVKQFEDSGTVFGSIGKEDFKKIESVIPPTELVEQFESETSTLDNKIYLNTLHIRTLTQMRDTLLPKLMRGEVRVKL